MLISDLHIAIAFTTYVVDRLIEGVITHQEHAYESSLYELHGTENIV